jgi:hypothetical protein
MLSEPFLAIIRRPLVYFSCEKRQASCSTFPSQSKSSYHYPGKKITDPIQVDVGVTALDMHED